MGYSVDSRPPFSSGSSLFSSPQLSFVTLSNLPESSSCDLCFGRGKGGWDDPLQCFLPSPFSFSSLSSLLPAPLTSSGPSTSSTYCLASVSVAKSIRRRGSRLGAAAGRGPADSLSSALRFVLKGKTSGTIEPGNITSPTREEPCEVQEKNKTGTDTLDTKRENHPSQALTTSKHLLAGAMSAVISRTIVAPLERLKLEYIVRGATSDVGVVVRKIISSEGLKGFWKGNLVNLIRTAPFKSINFYAYDLIRKRITAITGREITNFEKLAAGAAAGIFATVVCFPMDTIRTRIVAPGGEALGGITGCFQHLISSQGLSSLYAGLLPAIISMAPAGAVFYGVYDILKSGYIESPAGQEELRRRRATNCDQMELGPLRTLLYGAIAGACAETVTYPLEVVRRHLQMQNAANRLGLLHTVQALVHEKGVGGLYAGLLPSTLQVLPSAALSYFVYEWLKLSMKVS